MGKRNKKNEVNVNANDEYAVYCSENGYTGMCRDYTHGVKSSERTEKNCTVENENKFINKMTIDDRARGFKLCNFVYTGA